MWQAVLLKYFIDMMSFECVFMCHVYGVYKWVETAQERQCENINDYAIVYVFKKNNVGCLWFI
jgi:hypothetical protein